MPAAQSNPVSLPVVIDRSSSTPLYLQLAAAIEKAIREGRLEPGARIENELSMTQRLGLSRPTVRQGIQELVDKGMLVRKRGVGTQVVPSHVNRPVALTSLWDDLERSGSKPSTKVIEYRIGRASPEIAEKLALTPEDQVLETVRIRFVDGEPLAVMRNAVPERIAPSREELMETGLYKALARRGIRSSVANERIGATVADDYHSELLDEELGAPLLTMERSVYANDGSVIEYGRHMYRASLYSFEVNLVE